MKPWNPCAVSFFFNHAHVSWRKPLCVPHRFTHRGLLVMCPACTTVRSCPGPAPDTRAESQRNSFLSVQHPKLSDSTGSRVVRAGASGLSSSETPLLLPGGPALQGPVFSGPQGLLSQCQDPWLTLPPAPLHTGLALASPCPINSPAPVRLPAGLPALPLPFLQPSLHSWSLTLLHPFLQPIREGPGWDAAG